MCVTAKLFYFRQVLEYCAPICVEYVLINFSLFHNYFVRLQPLMHNTETVIVYQWSIDQPYCSSFDSYCCPLVSIADCDELLSSAQLLPL